MIKELVMSREGLKKLEAELEELKTVASLSKTVVDTLVQNGCLGSMPESNQMTLF